MYSARNEGVNVVQGVGTWTRPTYFGSHSVKTDCVLVGTKGVRDGYSARFSGRRDGQGLGKLLMVEIALERHGLASILAGLNSDWQAA